MWHLFYIFSTLVVKLIFEQADHDWLLLHWLVQSMPNFPPLYEKYMFTFFYFWIPNSMSQWLGKVTANGLENRLRVKKMWNFQWIREKPTGIALFLCYTENSRFYRIFFHLFDMNSGARVFSLFLSAIKPWWWQAHHKSPSIFQY